MELTVVAIVMGILAVSVVPALQSLTDARAAGARQELVRRLTEARDRAGGTATATGLELTLKTNTARLVTVSPTDGSVIPAADALGNPSAAWAMSAAFPGVSMSSVTLGDGSIGGGTVWFGADGTPGGTKPKDTPGSVWKTDTQIELSTGSSVLVRRGTGLIE